MSLWKPRTSEHDGVTQTGGGRVWRILVGSGFVIAASWFLASVIASPSKRNIEALAGIIFGGILLIASPFAALLFTVCLLPFPAHTSVASTSMLLILALAAMVVVRGRVEQLPSPFVSKEQDLSIMGLGLMVAISFYHQNPEAFHLARYLTLGLITAVILYYVTISLAHNEERLLRVIRTVQVVTILLGVLGIFQWVFPDKQILPEFFSFSKRVAENEQIRSGDVRVTATFNGQELFAEHLALSIVMQYFFLRWANRLWEKTFWVVGILILLAALFATATRGGLIVLVFGFLYIILFGSRIVPRAQSLKVAFVAISLFYLALGLVEPLVAHMMDRIASIGSGDSSMQSRSVVLPQALDAIARQPFMGHGMATAPGTFRGGVSMNIHNLYLTLAYTIGIPGLLAFLWMIWGLFKKSWSVAQDHLQPQRTRELGLALNTMLVMFLVDEIKIEYVRQPMVMHLTWLNFAFIVALWRQARTRAEYGALQAEQGVVR